ncbi:DNA replication and repair protein RecF [[Clostridium] cellulosi]|uniref:DNA replication and repair protein RecF n=1 Tax=[Clostridium] cellulosi TaxID=29343 RepID=A0A078KPQ2_9FIRM|nr:DNA replication and repair protein RecF [[Clostridium] cellulosi]
MIVKRLTCSNFRNFKTLNFEPHDGVNVLYGDNAQGKTNLIEAIWLFTGARSFRGSKDTEFIRFGEKITSISLDFFARNLENTASATLTADAKQFMLNGIKMQGFSSFSGQFCAVVFSPDHLVLLKSGPQHRRKFIDCAITEIWPRHAAVLNEYKNLLKQRNALLKDIPAHSELLDTLPVWDSRLASAGAAIVFARLRYLSRLKDKASAVYQGIASKTDEKLELDYESPSNSYPTDVSDQKDALAKIRASLEMALKNGLSGDLEAGLTRIGPHRDDIKISIGGVDSRLYSSQGQQRSAVLALKLAEAAVLKETIGEPPVLLLDDVMSELDRNRQNYILNNIGGFQVFITCCDPSGLEALSGGASFEVKNGVVERRK